MADKEKIVLLTRLALYDKYMSESDKKTNGYFMHDYIYAKNIRTRFFAFLGAAIVVGFYMINKVLVEKADIFTLDYRKELTGAALFIVIVLAAYTAIGGLRAASAYRASQKRIKAYLDVLKKTGEKTREVRYGRNIVYTGNNHQRDKKI